MVRRLISLPCLVMAAWALTLAWLLGDLRFQLFLAPKFKLLIYAGAALCLLFALGAASRPAQRQRDHLAKGLFLLLPILFIFRAGDNTLGNFALSKRGISPVAAPSDTLLPAPDRPHETAQNATQNPSAPPLVSISNLVREADAYEGKQISLEGLFSQTVVGHEELSAVFRYVITCCAADAMPVGVFTDRKEISGITDDSWVRITGRVHKIHLDGFDVLFMEKARVEKQVQPAKDAAYIFL